MFPPRRLLFGAVILTLSAASILAQSPLSKGGGIWNDVSERNVVRSLSASGGASIKRDIVPQVYRTLQMNKTSLANLLSSVVPESNGPIDVNGTELQVPLPSGEYARFLIQESSLMEPKLASQFPEIKTYVGKGIDDPTATMRMDVTPSGFHAIILSAGGQVFIDPYSRATDTNYISYYKRDFVASKPFSCVLEKDLHNKATALAGTSAAAKPTGGTLRSYRLALACTGEYAIAVCSPNPATVAGALAAMITSVNRCSAIYERELAIRFVLINNNDKLVYLSGSTDPYTNANGSTMLSQNQANIDSVIGNANYDFGHVFSTGGGGVAQLGVICRTGSKAKGVTGSSAPTGDPYDVDYVVHEMGHEFGANHPFNGTAGACSGNEEPTTAYEPGSGITIMAYAGICSPQDLAAHSDDYFHTISYDEIDAYTSGTGSGAACPVGTLTGNNPPTIGVLADRNIPMQTPFALTASGSDPDGDTLSYCWEEFDLGPAQDPTAFPRDNGASPIFRSFPPTTNPTRIFPSLTYILNNANVPPATVNTFATGEFLPTTSRAMTYRVTVRDNHSSGGGTNYGSMTVTSTTASGPFVITAPNSAATFAAGGSMTVNWDVANTTAAPVNCANVKISLSTDGGYTFPIVLAASVANSPGSAVVTIPNIANVATTQGRVKVEAVGNVFFDISDANLTITSSNTAPTVTINDSITVVRGTPAATVATVGTAVDTNGNSLTLSVSDVPFGATITPSLVGSNISFSAVVGCAVVTTLTTRTYPVTLTVTDSVGSSTSRTVDLVVTPNPSPSLGGYPDVTVSPSSSVNSTPASAAADANNNLAASPYSVLPTTLPGGGTVTVNQATGVVTVTTTGGTTLGTTNIRVTALDSCGAAAVSLFKVNVASTNPVLQAGTASAPTAEGCPPANGAADPGETVTINFPINNIGGGATSNLVATLQNSGGVTPITTSQNYGAIAANGSTTRAFQLTTTGSCGGTVTATLQLQDGATNYGTVTFVIRLGVLVNTTTLLQNFDSLSAPALPVGWTAVVASGSMTPWASNTTTPDTAPNSVSAATITTPSDNRLTSPSVAIPSSAAQISFRHRWNLESGYDGGILEIAINGGAFTDIISAGGSFVSGPYNSAISSTDGSPIAGANAWTGSFNTSYTTTLVNIPPSAAGQNAQFRWRLACDTGIGGGIWRVDTINIISGGYVCASCSSPPAITNGPPPSPAIVGTPYNFAFTATGNPAPTFSLTNGTLPPGLTLSPGGVISGTPASAGNGSFPNITVTASNGNPPNAQQTFALSAATRVANYLAGFGLSGGNAVLTFDFEGDGITNLLEYALSLNPTVANLAGLPVVIVKNYSGVNYLSMTFTRSSVATDLTYTVQGSSDLVNWSPLAASTGGGATSGTGFVTETGPAPLFTVEVRDTVPLDGTPGLKRFLRLQITSP